MTMLELLLVMGVWAGCVPGFLAYRLQKRFQEVERKQFYDLLNKQRKELMQYELILQSFKKKEILND